MLQFDFLSSVTHSKSTYVSEFLAILLFLEFLPVPIDLNVLLMTCDNFSLNFVSALVPILLLFIAAILFLVVGVALDLSYRLERIITCLDQVD